MDQFDPIQIRYSGRELRQLVEMTAQTATTVQQVSLISKYKLNRSKLKPHSLLQQ